MPRHTYEQLQPRVTKAAGLDYEHIVRIALPPTYHDFPAKTYPTLWVTDASVAFDTVVGVLNVTNLMLEIPELIVVGVGCPPDVDATEFNVRRFHDFYSEPEWLTPGPVGDQVGAILGDAFRDAGGGADTFLDFLIDELRPELGREFRFDDHDHGLVGHSAGGYLVGYALLSRPGAFTRFLAGSPALSCCRDRLFQLEAAYAASHDDLAARLFLAFGGAEPTDPWTSLTDIGASTVRMAQILATRQYPSLSLYLQVFPDQTHASVVPSLVLKGLKTLYPRTPPTAEDIVSTVSA
ncbi:alpha/beta hydrolase [Amycolatopsis japonica]